MHRLASLVLLAGCTGADAPGPDRGPDDAPGGATAADTGEPSPLTGDEVLVVPDGRGIAFLDLDGGLVSAAPWVELVGPCGTCGAEGASPDGDGLLVSFTTGGGGGGGGQPLGGVARVGLDGRLGFRLDGFGFPHDVIRDPADGSVIVVETSANRLVWLAGDGSSDQPVRTLSSDDSELPPTPNGAERIDHDGRTYLVISHRPQTGRITLWDITEPGAPTFLWRFPSSGGIDVPHAPILRERGGHWWLIWAHTEGLGRLQGTVGIARTSDLTQAPAYVADLQPDDNVGPLTFLRGVELAPDDRLFLTDSGRGRGDQGRVIEARWPDLAPSGLSGAAGDRRFVDLGPASVIRDELVMPYEGWLWDQVIGE